jgi:hypothetical protein
MGLPLTSLNALGAAPAVGDLMYIVDISEPVPADQSKSLTVTNLFTSPLIATPTMQVSDAITNTTSTVATFRHITSGVAAAAFGLSVVSELEDASGAVAVAGGDSVRWKDAAAATLTAQRIFSLQQGAAITPYFLSSGPDSLTTSTIRTQIGAVLGLALLPQAILEIVPITGDTSTVLQVSSGLATPVATFGSSGEVVLNEQGTSAGDLRVEGDTLASLLFTDASADMVCINGTNPDARLTVVGNFVTRASVLVDAATVAVNARLSNQFQLTLVSNRTLGNPTNAVDGQVIVFEITQDGAGNRTLTLDTKYNFGSTIASITLSTAAGARDLLTVRYCLAADLFDVVAFVAGY